MFERYTDRARRVVVLAQEEARTLNHNYIGTEHLLLGLLHEGEGIAAKVLIELGFTLDHTRVAVEELVNKGSQAPSGHIPFTPNTKKVLELGLREALQLGHNFIGTEHLLLGLLRANKQESGGDALGVTLLEKLGTNVHTVRRATLDWIGKTNYSSTAASSAPDPRITATLTKVHADPEIKAMELVLKALVGLDATTQNRIVRWALERLSTSDSTTQNG